MLAPIVLFTYARLDHLHQTIQALKSDTLSKESDLVIYSDAAKNDIDYPKVMDVRRFIECITGFKSIKIHIRRENYGLANSIISGVSDVLRNSESVIVLEDDLVVAPHFLSYMNTALEKYSNNDSVASVHGYTYPCNERLPSTFFLRGADCWGWGTWRRAWNLFNPDGRYLLNEIEKKNLVDCFNFDGTYPFTQMLEDQIQGKNDSWAIRWSASVFLQNKLTLYPGTSLVQNIGNDGSGVHKSDESIFSVALADHPIEVENIPVLESDVARKAFMNYFRKHHNQSRGKSICSKFIRLYDYFR